MTLSRGICHCGGQIYVHDYTAHGGGLFSRGLCQSCDEERCDAPQEGQRYSCQVVVEAETEEVLRIAAEARKRWAGALRLLAEGGPDGPAAR